MKVYERFKKGQNVYVITKYGVRNGIYVRLNTPGSADVRDLENYRDRQGTVATYGEFSVEDIFSSREALAKFLLEGTAEELPVVKEYESRFNVGGTFWELEDGRPVRRRISTVRFRLGEFEYYGDWGGCAYYCDRAKDVFDTREDAVKAYLAL